MVAFRETCHRVEHPGSTLGKIPHQTVCSLQLEIEDERVGMGLDVHLQ